MRVHPRGCGEAADALALPPAPLGPSPRVRGSPTVVPPLDMSQGSIPAGAGKPKPFCSSPPSIRVHPRGCGEARSAFDSATHSGGPSPRVRGSLRRDFIFVVSPRSIPAGAGKPAVLRARRLLHRVHPRGCGEAPEGRAPAVGRGGPSPRVRGSHSTRLRFASILGSIPAGAGKPMTDRITADGWRVHPRGCGEADRLDVALPRLQGPSPRVRGSLAGETERCIRSGSIPAGAGKPSPCRQGSLWFRVHPRGCGEVPSTCSWSYASLGPSPRVRGSPAPTEERGGRLGSIPAGAGKPNIRSVAFVNMRVHPRGCGEAARPPGQLLDVRGPSPRVRGSRATRAASASS